MARGKKSPFLSSGRSPVGMDVLDLILSQPQSALSRCRSMTSSKVILAWREYSADLRTLKR